MIILEAMAMKKPIIATQIDGITEQIDHNRSGILVPPGNSNALSTEIIRLLDDVKLREHLGMNAKKRVEEAFSVQKMISETESIYRSLIPL